MLASPKFKTFWVTVLIISVFAIMPNAAYGQLVTYLSSVTTSQDNDSISIDITVDNFSGDSITGFTLWISLSHAEYIGFYSDSVYVYDTTYSNCLEDSCVIMGPDSCLFWTCNLYADTAVDSGWVMRGAFDTTGTLTSGWDFIDATILDGGNKSVKINAIANQSVPFTPGIPSPTSSGLLCRLQLEVKPWDEGDSCEMWVDDSLIHVPWDQCYCDSTVFVTFDTTQTRFSNEFGEFIGWEWSDTAWTCLFVPPDFHTECVRRCVVDSCVDSTCFYEYNSNCYLWECDSCTYWDSSGYVDPAQVLFVHGQIDVECITYICGDANGDTKVNVSDAVYIINYVFTGGAAPNPIEAGNANCDTGVNVSDAVFLINYVFMGGNDPCDSYPPSPNGDGIPDC